MARVPIPDSALIAAIESSLHVYPPVPGLSTDLGIPGVRGRITTLSHPLANLMGMARLSERDMTEARKLAEILAKKL